VRVTDDNERPWGRYDVLGEDASYKVKSIVVKPGARLSYQRHGRRSEHWYVVAGSGVVTLDGEAVAVSAGSAVDVAVGAAHRMANTGDEPLVFVEVQRGEYFGEDDIVRIEDDYGR
jgi:mannose-6-phosphate isomerase